MQSSSFHTSLVGSVIVLTAIQITPAVAQESAGASADGEQVTFSLLKYGLVQKSSDSVSNSPSPTRPVPTVGAESRRDTRRQALQFLADAEAAFDSGQYDRAATLARDAQRLYPESRAIAGFLATLKADAPAPTTGASTRIRAAAHLAAALTRAQILMQQRRYTESLDLLNGIVEAAGKLPAAADVSMYHDLARKELLEYRVAVQSGRIRPNADTPLPRPSQAERPQPSTGQPPPLEFPAAPANAYRLARLAKEQTPAWYARHRSALRRLVSVDYGDMPLALVLDDLRDVTGVPIIVDKPVLAARSPLMTQVDLRIGSVPAETVLSLAVQLAGCEYVLLEKGVIVTTADKAGDYIRTLPDSVTQHWARMRHLFPDLYVEAMTKRPLPEAKPGDRGTADDPPGSVPAYLRSGRDLVADIEQLIR